MEKTKVELIRELEDIRIRITQIYIELGNPDYAEADSVLSKDINKLRTKLNIGSS